MFHKSCTSRSSRWAKWAFTDDEQMSCVMLDGSEVYVEDHPFMFVLREDVISGAVLFIGQLLDPLAG